MGNTEFGALIEAQAGHSNTIAGLRADVGYWKNRAERAEFARQALEHHSAALTQQLADLRASLQPAVAKDSESTIVHNVLWSYCDITVDVELGWDSPESVWLRGVEISDLIAGYPNHVLSRLNDLAREQHEARLADDAADMAAERQIAYREAA